MKKATTIGLDVAKSVFQVHGIDAAGGVVVRRKLRRPELLEFFAALPSALAGMEVCGGAHDWARGSRALATRCGVLSNVT